MTRHDPVYCIYCSKKQTHRVCAECFAERLDDDKSAIPVIVTAAKDAFKAGWKDGKHGT